MPTIAELNDAFRTNPTPSLGKVVLTRGILDDGPSSLAAVATAVQSFDKFEPGDDPYGEHDFGAVTVEGHRIFWKIDYYDRYDDTRGSEDPADPEKTLQVMTIMLAEEY